MSDSPTFQTRPAVTPAVDMVQPGASPLETWSPVFARLQSWALDLSSANAAIQKEWLGFVGRRLEQDVALPQRMTACKAPDEAWRIYMDFLQTTADDYRREALELARLSGSLSGEADTLPNSGADFRTSLNGGI